MRVRVIDALRVSTPAVIDALHEAGKRNAAEVALTDMEIPTTFEGGVVHLTLNDVKDELTSAINKALEAR